MEYEVVVGDLNLTQKLNSRLINHGNSEVAKFNSMRHFWPISFG